jgi:hypothetical protein
VSGEEGGGLTMIIPVLAAVSQATYSSVSQLHKHSSGADTPQSGNGRLTLEKGSFKQKSA